MIIIIGLIILVVAAIAGVAAVLGNAGHGHDLTSSFSMLGYHVTGSTGALFLYGIVVGAVAMLGLALLLGGARRSSRRGIVARRSLRQSRRETTAVSQDRDDLIGQRDEAARALADSTSADSTSADSTSADSTSADSTSGDSTLAGSALADSARADSTAGPAPVDSARADNGPGHWLRGLGRRLSPPQAPVQQHAPVQASPVVEPSPVIESSPVADSSPVLESSPSPETAPAPADESAPDVPAGAPASV
jgi:hypothetical protein